MKIELCIILKLFLNFSNSEPEYFYKFYSYEKSVHEFSRNVRIKSN